MLKTVRRWFRLAKRSYWFGQSNPWNSELLRGARTTGAKQEGRQGIPTKWSARELCRNIVGGQNLVEHYATRLVGDGGPRLRMATGDPDLDDRIEGAFERWAATCTFDGRGLDQVVELVGRELAVVGEAFWYWAVENGKLVLVPFEPEDLTGAGTSSTGLFADGIERDAAGRALAYNLWLEDARLGGGRTLMERLPASRVCHIFRQERPGQIRGTSPFVQVGNVLQMLDKSIRGELGAILLSGYAGLHVKTPPDSAPLDFAGAAGFGDPVSEEAVGSLRKALTADDFSLADGAIHVGDFDLSLVKADRPGGAYLPFMQSILRMAAARFGLPYALISGDYSQNSGVNGRLEELSSRQYNSIMRRLVSSRFLKEFVFRQWLKTEGYGFVAPATRSLDDYVYLADFAWPAHPLLDAQHEVMAMQAAIGIGVSTWSQAVTELGHDPIDQMREIAKEQAEAKRLGVQIPIAGSMAGVATNPTGAGGGAQGPATEPQGNAAPG